MDLTDRQLQLLIAFPIFIIIAVILGFLILRRDPKYRANQCFALSFWLNGMALLFNLIYLFSTDVLFISIFNKLSITMLNIGLIVMIVAILILLKGENEIMQDKRVYLLIISCAILIIFHNFLPVGVSLPEFLPAWSISFGIFQILFSQIFFIVLLYFCIQLYNELTSDVKKKFRRFVIGIIFIDLTTISITIQNMQLFPNYESIAGLFNLGAFIGIILIYYGIIRR